MLENNPHLEYQSINKNAHMCGHDGHLASLLGGTAKILEDIDQIPSNKTIKMFF